MELGGYAGATRTYRTAPPPASPAWWTGQLTRAVGSVVLQVQWNRVPGRSLHPFDGSDHMAQFQPSAARIQHVELTVWLLPAKKRDPVDLLRFAAAATAWSWFFDSSRSVVPNVIFDRTPRIDKQMSESEARCRPIRGRCLTFRRSLTWWELGPLPRCGSVPGAESPSLDQPSRATSAGSISVRRR